MNIEIGYSQNKEMPGLWLWSIFPYWEPSLLNRKRDKPHRSRAESSSSVSLFPKTHFDLCIVRQYDAFYFQCNHISGNILDIDEIYCHSRFVIGNNQKFFSDRIGYIGNDAARRGYAVPRFPQPDGKGDIGIMGEIAFYKIGIRLIHNGIISSASLFVWLHIRFALDFALLAFFIRGFLWNFQSIRWWIFPRLCFCDPAPVLIVRRLGINKLTWRLIRYYNRQH